MPEQARVSTPFQTASVAELLRLELVAQNLDPHRDMAALLLGQISFETGSGTACQNHNVGNISALDGPTAPDYFRPTWFAPAADAPANILALHAAMLKNQAPRAFRSYVDFATGVKDYVRVATQLGVVEAARTGDEGITAAAIKRAYTPDAPPTLAKTLDTFRRDYLARGLFDPLPLDRAAETPRDRGLLRS